jgi:hypothetical protein
MRQSDPPQSTSDRRGGKEQKRYTALFRDLVLAVFARDRVREKGKQMLSETYADRKNSKFEYRNPKQTLDAESMFVFRD